MSKLSFSTLREANKRRLPLFKNNKGEPAHTEADGSDWSRAEWLEATVGEIGEYANFSKKFRRGDITEEEFAVHARKELADAVCYIDLLAMQLKIDLGEAVVQKFNEISERVGADVVIEGDQVYHPKSLPPDRTCKGCGNLGLDAGDFVCFHPDSGTFGCNPAMATGSAVIYKDDRRFGHCGKSLMKWRPHNLRTADGRMLSDVARELAKGEVK